MSSRTSIWQERAQFTPLTLLLNRSARERAVMGSSLHHSRPLSRTSQKRVPRSPRLMLVPQQARHGTAGRWKPQYLLGLHSNVPELVFQGNYTCLLELNIHVPTRCLTEIRLIYPSEELYTFQQQNLKSKVFFVATSPYKVGGNDGLSVYWVLIQSVLTCNQIWLLN